MRDEAKKIYEQLTAGKSIGQIPGNNKTKGRVHKIFHYRKLMDRLIDDMANGNYTLSIYDIQKLLKQKNDGR